MRVLVVDDSAFARKIASEMLRKQGHDVAEAGGGRDAIEQYLNSRPDLVLLEITMPGMDGLETLVALRRIDRAPTVVMVTALGSQQVILEALGAGASDFVPKPFTPEKLARVLRLRGSLAEAS